MTADDPVLGVPARIQYRCKDCSERFVDASSSNAHHDATRHNQTFRCYVCDRPYSAHTDAEYWTCHRPVSTPLPSAPRETEEVSRAIVPCPNGKCGGSPAGVLAGVCLMCLSYSTVWLELELEKHDWDSENTVDGVEPQALKDTLDALGKFEQECKRLQTESANLQEAAIDNHDSYLMEKSKREFAESQLSDLRVAIAKARDDFAELMTDEYDEAHPLVLGMQILDSLSSRTTTNKGEVKS